ncbi:unnamed protein product [Mytilus coruscus]|uniref:Endonuclease/exonuclease/phosphatase domain-containing protein n=1 Tax=Mytilus coruscus TaxID=42192 RepID=A0A6J8DDW6_MYTCO|nr:unnamed protein product [Mytilus coruscus]
MSFDQAKQKAQQKGETIPKIINYPVSEDETIPKIISTSNVTPGKSYADSVKSKQEVLHNLSHNIVLLGDFNSRSSMWGSSTTDSNGNIIEKVIDQNNMIILNDGTGTFQTVTGNRTQIDLTLVSASLANDSQWSVLDDQLGSDHFPVLTVLNGKPVKNKVCTPQRWIYDKADWHRFTTLCNEINIDNIKHDDIGIFNQNLCEVVTKIADETIPKTSGTKGPPFLKYYARTKQNPSNPANQLVDDCIEYQIYNHKWNDHNIPYGFRVQNLLKDNDLDKIKLVTKNFQDPPPWIIGQAKTSSNIKNSISKKENPHIIKTKALEYIDNAYKNHLKIYTDGSKDPASGKTGYASLIPSRPTTLQELSGSVTQKWSQAVTGSNNSIFTTKTVRTKEKIVKKTNYTARVIRVSDSEMESGRNRQHRRLFKTVQQNIVKKINYTARVIRSSGLEDTAFYGTTNTQKYHEPLITWKDGTTKLRRDSNMPIPTSTRSSSYSSTKKMYHYLVCNRKSPSSKMTTIQSYRHQTQTTEKQITTRIHQRDRRL